MTQPACPRHAPLDQLRGLFPLYRDDASKSFVVSRMADARLILGDNSLWKDPDRSEPGALIRQFKPKDMNGSSESRNAGIGWMDDPDHARVRRPIQQALWRRSAAARPFLEDLAGRLLDDLATRERFDLAADYAAPIPIVVMGHILGIDTADFDRFRDWSEKALDIFRPDRTPEEAALTSAAMSDTLDFLQAQMDRRRGAGADDLIGDLLAVQEGGAPLSDTEIRVNLLNLMLGGNLTVADTITTGAWLLLTHPAERAKLAADPALINGAVEEILRYEPPGEGAQRVMSREITLHGCPVHEGQVVAALLHAANRDPEAFTDPHRFDITRREGPHISFGAGSHICIGAPLARLQIQVALGRLMARLPNLRLTDPDAAPEWRPIPIFRGMDHLMVSP